MAKATWIWYPGDFEIWLGNIFNNRRTERGSMFPPFWKQDSHWPTVEFSKEFQLEENDSITIWSEGRYNLMVDGKLVWVPTTKDTASGLSKATLVIAAGSHKLNLKVWNQSTPPALFIDGKTIKTDSTWKATYEDKLWIDENGVAHGSGIYVDAASWNFDSPCTPPSRYRLDRKELRPVAEDGGLYDFGRETFGYLKLKGLKGRVRVYYGESREEALDKDHCETLDVISEGEEPGSKAFRYVYIEKEDGAEFGEVAMDYEFAPQDDERSGCFVCSDERLNKIWQVAAYTMDLTTREFFMDGIKRDRWTWSGDAIQSYLINYYYRFDMECTKRTIRQLRGKDPVTAHVNTIMDYTFYWYISIFSYYLYSGDKAFLVEIHQKMLTLMDYVQSRIVDGQAAGKPDDWIFVDWVDFPMHKRGVLSFEQILYSRAVFVLWYVCAICGDNANALKYAKIASEATKFVKEKFWSEKLHAFMHSIEDGQMNEQVTKFPNMMAIIFNFADDDKKKAIMEHVMLNPDVPPITTPYMRFYELEALCIMGRHDIVLKEMVSYWGGMIDEGATTFWEKYNPDEKGAEHLAMYGRPYGKSLCHAWGASPIYLLGRYFLGVRPTYVGYKEYAVEPHLGTLEWIEGAVPTTFGLVRVKMTRTTVSVLSDGGKGKLNIAGKEYDIVPGEKLEVNYA